MREGPIVTAALAALALGCTGVMEFERAGELDAGGGGATSTGGPLGPTGSFALSFEETCASAGVDRARWTTQWVTAGYPFRAMDHTYEYVADEAVTVSDGLCVITATDTPVGDRPFTSGTLATSGTFAQRFGYFEVRLRAPAGAGLWSTFWLRHAAGWPPSIQAIVMGHRPDALRTSMQWTEAGESRFEEPSVVGPSYTTDFHVLGIEWRPDSVAWYVDGVEQRRTTSGVATMADPMELSLALLVGIRDVTDPPYPDETTPWPARLEIDWVRVWSER